MENTRCVKDRAVLTTVGAADASEKRRLSQHCGHQQKKASADYISLLMMSGRSVMETNLTQ